jgi:hypothetical protein
LGNKFLPFLLVKDTFKNTFKKTIKEKYEEKILEKISNLDESSKLFLYSKLKTDIKLDRIITIDSEFSTLIVLILIAIYH